MPLHALPPASWSISRVARLKAASASSGCSPLSKRDEDSLRSRRAWDVRRRVDGVEVGRLQEHGGCVFSHLRVEAAHNPGQRYGALGVRNDQHGRVQGMRCIVQGDKGLLLVGGTHDDLAIPESRHS